MTLISGEENNVTALSEVDLTGPRLGITYLSKSTREEIREELGMNVTSIVTQFGWYFEK